jgi:hypothetical protein
LSVLFLIPITKSSIKRWIDAIGAHLPPQRRCCGTYLPSLRQRSVILTATTLWGRTIV